MRSRFSDCSMHALNYAMSLAQEHVAGAGCGRTPDHWLTSSSAWAAISLATLYVAADGTDLSLTTSPVIADACAKASVFAG
jgi:hypothetical protein